MLLDRRAVLLSGAVFLVLPGCATLGSFVFEDGIRRLLTLSSQRAFARLLQDNGFFQDELARIDLPPELRGAGSVASALLATPLVRNQVLEIANRAAARGAEAAAPLVYNAIRDMSLADAASLARGGPTAATDFLERAMGDAIVEAMFPRVGEALRAFDTGILGRVVQQATNVTFPGLQRHVTQSAARGIYRAIGREEAAIRADPTATGDPLIETLFGRRG